MAFAVNPQTGERLRFDDVSQKWVAAPPQQVAEPAPQPPAVEPKPPEEEPFSVRLPFTTPAPKLPEFITGAERETAATRELPEIGRIGTGDIKKDFQVAAGLLAAVEPKDQMDVIKSVVPEATFEEDEKGNVIVDLGEGKRAILNKPGLSEQDLLQTTAQVLSFIPAAKIAGLGKTLLAKIGIGAAGAAATEAGIQEAAVAAGAEKARDPTKVTTAGLLGGAAEAVVPAVQAFRQARRAKQIGAAAEDIEDVAQAAARTRPATEATGVELFPAQQTQAAEALLEQRLVQQLPAGSKKAAQALRTQNKQSAAAVNTFLDQIAPPEAVITGPAKFRTAAQNVVERAKNIRAEKTSPIYRDAFKQSAKVDVNPVQNLIKSELAELPASGEMARSINKVSGLIDDSRNLKQLHNAKLEIDQMLNKVGDNSLGNTTKAKLVDIKDQLLTQMDDASPLYRQARETFAAESPAVTQIQDSIVGNIAKIDDAQLKRISGRIFDPAETNPQVIRQAKKLIDDVDPDAWNQLLRSEIERKMGGLSADVSAETIENVPGQLHRVLFGNEKGRRILFNSVDGETAKNMKYLETVLKRASTGRAPGSPTIPFSEIRDRINKGVLRSVRDSFRQPIQTLASTGEEAQFNKAVRSLSNAVFDPQWRPQMAKLRKLNPNSPAAARAMAQLLNDAEEK